MNKGGTVVVDVDNCRFQLSDMRVGMLTKSARGLPVDVYVCQVTMDLIRFTDKEKEPQRDAMYLRLATHLHATGQTITLAEKNKARSRVDSKVYNVRKDLESPHPVCSRYSIL